MPSYKFCFTILISQAGLFSAVLTAFLIESYHSLQPPDSSRADNAEAMGLFREIAANTRGYLVGPGYFNATFAPPPGPSAALSSAMPVWSPPETAIRVNSLWFASLVFSLATASFGMFVKQWLREYLACKFISPRARLRTRQHRNPGMQAWMVFEIAATLPLLLQIYLALFFIGLCYFTSSIDPTVNRATTLLVCAWAFLVISSIIIPIFYPSCPYKTPALIQITDYSRLAFVAFRQRAHELLVRLGSPEAHISGLATFNRTALWLHAAARVAAMVAKPTAYKEEESVAQDDDNDVAVLISVDAALADDSLLATTIWESLQQLQPAPSIMLHFLMQVLGHRVTLPTVLQALPRSYELLDLRALTLEGWHAVTDIAGTVLARGLDLQSTSGWSDDTKDALLVLLSYSSFPLPDTNFATLRRCLNDNHLAEYMLTIQRIVGISARDSVIHTHILECFRRPFEASPRSRHARSTMTAPQIVALCLVHGCAEQEFWEFILTHPTPMDDDSAITQRASQLLDESVTFFEVAASSASRSPEGGVADPKSTDRLVHAIPLSALLILLGPRLCREGRLLSILKTACRSAHDALTMFRLLSRTCSPHRPQEAKGAAADLVRITFWTHFDNSGEYLASERTKSIISPFRT